MEEFRSNNHPTKDIKGSKSSKLAGKTICLCLTGSVSIMDSPHVARNLIRHGAEVITVMSQEAMRLLQPTLLEWSTGNPVITEISGKIEHVSLAGEREGKKGFADLILICPATANTIGKIASGISDTPVTAISMVALGSKITPLIIVPSMHLSMFQNPFVQKNIRTLEKMDVKFLNPRIEESKAKIATVDDVSSYVLNYFTRKKDLKGKKFLITAGPSREWIDNIRFLSNPSSGKTGIAYAKEIIERGGEVTIIYGPGTEPTPIGAEIIHVNDAIDFSEALNDTLVNNRFDVLISTAAIADFTPKNKKIEGKISSDKKDLLLNLVSTPKLINLARSLSEKLFIIAYKAENNLVKEILIEKAYNRLKSANVDLIIANNISPSNKNIGFNSDTNEVFVIDKDKNVHHLKLASKQDIASKILDLLLERI
ncbi:bifunctional phosphopantothenoylcysteine decarboxylase/phosphopantothenate--cysteine ligase CoaBC [Promethearchaeum syntrophicum]|uniref:Coenzyme A biosynthesis bifunctional protein CoaBC n=1 Tax=Promethearchaeum syntrophicum TaxID=2594042 RepID=A0A5B9D5N9_9ARCH|nr:bifunctional phosphopantothenoylcysteine decarboxylase/phosphopantothenate--cysteine ligase CoaBC [Candidatus Prometheoarchaeum syntrophicum]QEE14335.1 bifunctional phosphopantothenoylcysteine decarboxylase/phosphopantothenate synthase [Candidatus Prometheoarchaeum syntrophicum]